MAEAQRMIATPAAGEGDLGPRAASIVAWVTANRHQIEAVEYGELVFLWHEAKMRATLKRSEQVPPVAARAG